MPYSPSLLGELSLNDIISAMKSYSRPSFLRQFSSAILLGVLVIAGLLVLWMLGVSLLFMNRILPGVSLNGTSLAGLTEAQAVRVISTSYSFPQTGHILLQADQNSWLVNPDQLGVYLDAESSAKEALAVGRADPLDLYEATLFGYSTSPTFIFDQRVALQYLNGLASQLNQPVKEASLSIDNAQVTIIQGQPGRVLDIATSLQTLSQQITRMQDGIVQLTVSEVQPKVMDVTRQGEQVKAILSQPLLLSIPAGQNTPPVGPWTINPADLAGLLTLNQSQPGNSTANSVEINQPLMAAYLKSIEDQINQDAQNARFTFNDGTGQLDLIQPSVLGRAINIDKTVAAINDAILKGQHSVALQLDIVQPQVADNATGAQLGISELVYSYTSYFRSSSSDRVHNIQIAAATFHGLLVAPGQTLSMSDVLGNISLDNGYAEAPIILGDQTIQGVGGGVCQVSTTLFRTAFFAGYSIVERHPHSYRVGYYEQTATGHDANLAGLDATVFVPLVDFKFKNDTPYWLLMETYVNTNNDSLTWKFYSTKDGRVVNWDSSGPTDLKDPPDPTYIENPTLPAGTIKQTDWAVQGATVSVDRTVTLNGTVISSDHIVTKYEPWPDIYDYGPGTEGIPTPTPKP